MFSCEQRRELLMSWLHFNYFNLNQDSQNLKVLFKEEELDWHPYYLSTVFSRLELIECKKEKSGFAKWETPTKNPGGHPQPGGGGLTPPAHGRLSHAFGSSASPVFSLYEIALHQNKKTKRQWGPNQCMDRIRSNVWIWGPLSWKTLSWMCKQPHSDSCPSPSVYKNLKPRVFQKKRKRKPSPALNSTVNLLLTILALIYELH